MRGALCALALSIGLAAAPAIAQGCDRPEGAAALLDQVDRLVDVQRAANGRSALARDPRLARAAADHACWIAATGRYGHEGAQGSTPRGRVAATGYRSCLTAENIAMGQAGAGEVMADWMASRGHRDNILRADLAHIGLGLARRDGRPVWVLVLARPC